MARTNFNIFFSYFSWLDEKKPQPYNPFKEHYFDRYHEDWKRKKSKYSGDF